MMRNSILWAAALLLAVSCGGGAPVTDQPADLSPYKTDSGLYTFTVKGETVQLAEIPAGTFAMGETLDMGRYRTPSIHQVILGSNPSPKDVPTAPVTSVTYNDVQKFLKKLSKATGVPFRLPTEAEWEYAARQREGMAGGAWEWCSDRWAEDLGYHMAINPQGPETGDQYALRGGSALEKDNKPISRKGMAPTSKASDVGLRLAVSLNAPYPQELKDVLVDNKIPREHFEAADMKPETMSYH